MPAAGYCTAAARKIMAQVEDGSPARGLEVFLTGLARLALSPELLDPSCSNWCDSRP